MGIINLAAGDSFDAIIGQEQNVVVVDFWAPWCGPCRLLSPELAGVAEELGDKVQIVKVNVDDFGDLAASRYKVMGVPSVLVFKGGQEQGRLTGYRPKKALREFIEKYL